MASAVNLPNPGSYMQKLSSDIVALRTALQNLINDAGYLNAQGGATFLEAAPYSLSAADATLIMATIGAVVPTNSVVIALQAFLVQTESLWGGQ